MAENHNIPDDTYARDSFSLRRMTQGQVWAITIVGIAVLVGLLLYATI